MDPNVTTSLVGVLILASIWIIFVLNRSRDQKQRAEDEARREVERITNESHRNLITSDDLQVAQALTASNAETAEVFKDTANRTEHQLSEIHDAVNSNLTEAKERISALEAEVRTLLNELRKRDRGDNVAPDG